MRLPAFPAIEAETDEAFGKTCMRRAGGARVAIAALLCYALTSWAYLTDRNVHRPSDYDSFEPPSAGHSYVDPVFGTVIKRISDARHTRSADNGEPVRSVETEYSTVCPFNSDNSRILLSEFTYFALYDGSGKRIKPLRLEVNTSSEPRWSRTDPKIFYYHFRNQLKKYNVDTDATSVLHVFREYRSISAQGEMDISEDGDHLAYAGDGRHIFLYTLSTGTKSQELETRGRPWDNIHITPDNHLLVTWNKVGRDRFNGIELFDENMKFLRQIAISGQHMHVTRDTDGSEIVVLP